MANILIVDDETAIRNLLKAVLIADGHRICEAKNGEEAAAKYKAFPPDLLITDLIMPLKNGFQLIKELQENNPGLRILAISGGSGINEAFIEYEHLGLHTPSHLLRKPFDLNTLRSTVSEMLS